MSAAHKNVSYQLWRLRRVADELLRKGSTRLGGEVLQLSPEEAEVFDRAVRMLEARL